MNANSECIMLFKERLKFSIPKSSILAAEDVRLGPVSSIHLVFLSILLILIPKE